MKKIGRKILIIGITLLIVVLLILSSIYIRNQNLKSSNVSSDNPLKATENYTWTQDKTTVTNGEVTLEVGSKITGYEGNGITDWYVLGAESGRLLLTTNVNVDFVEETRIKSNVNGTSTLNSAASVYRNSTLASGVRAININDINRVTGYNPSVHAASYKMYGSSYTLYGNSVTFTRGSYTYNGAPADTKVRGTKYPTEDKYFYSNSNYFFYPSSSTSLGYFNSGSKTFKSTAYEYYPQTLSTTSSTETSINGSNLAYNLLFANTNGDRMNNYPATQKSTNCYWLANNFIVTYGGDIRWRSFWSTKW